MTTSATEPTAKKQGAVARLLSTYWNSGAALITTAAFLFSLTSLAVKLIGDEVPTFQIVLVPGLVCFVATSLVVSAYGLNVRNRSYRVTGLTLLRGLLGATSITCFYLAIEMLPLQDAVTLFFCSPVVAALLELVVTGESHGWAGAAATACTVAGVVLVSQPECLFRHGTHHMEGDSGTSAAGVILATTAAVANAAAFVVVRLLKKTQSTVVLTWWYHTVVVAVTAVPLALRYPAPAVIPSRRCVALLGVVGATQFVGQLLLNRGFQLESATRGSAINVLQVLFSFLWDVSVLGDKPGVVSVAGSSLVAAGVLFVALTPAHDAHHRHPHHHRGTHHHPAVVPDGGGGAGQEALALLEEARGSNRSSFSVGVGGGSSVSGGGSGSSGVGTPGEAGSSEGALQQPLLLRVVGRLSMDTAT